jgi:hypothetical protein
MANAWAIANALKHCAALDHAGVRGHDVRTTRYGIANSFPIFL